MDEQRELGVRRAGTSDLDAVARVWHESALAMTGATADMPTAEALRHRINVECRSGWDLYVALRRERVVGMLALNPDAAILDQIFVVPGEQGKGVGRVLLNVAKQLMPAGFTLRMDASNEKARCFYEAEGMKKLREGFHPSTGAPVHFYGWNVR